MPIMPHFCRYMYNLLRARRAGFESRLCDLLPGRWLWTGCSTCLGLDFLLFVSLLCFFQLQHPVFLISRFLCFKKKKKKPDFTVWVVICKHHILPCSSFVPQNTKTGVFLRLGLMVFPINSPLTKIWCFAHCQDSVSVFDLLFSILILSKDISEETTKCRTNEAKRTKNNWFATPCWLF